jgi:hypothetical protein
MGSLTAQRPRSTAHECRERRIDRRLSIATASAGDATDGGARFATLGSAERGSRHDVSLSDGSREGSGRDDLRSALSEVASGPRREELRGLATAALWDLGMTDRALELALELSNSKVLGNVAWATLVRAASLRGMPRGAHDSSLVGEIPFRWIQWGWLE